MRMGVLIDPDKPWYALEVRDDGSALLNDGVKLKAANDNPWYRLATVYGEQTGRINSRRHAKNRRIWNGWACSEMDEATRAAMAEKLELPVEDLAPLSEEELAMVCARLDGLDASAFGEVDLTQDGLPDPRADVVLSNTHFSNAVVLERCVFAADASFTYASFSGYASFASARFSGSAWFTYASFSGPARFTYASFSGYASFTYASFSGPARFSSASFSGPAWFSSASFSEDALFESTSFSGPADFSDGSFRGQTSFKSVQFGKVVPKFYQREMHQDTSFTAKRENWPEVTAETAEESKRAYTRLRQIMLELEKPDDAQFFFRQEMRCKGKLETGLARLANLGFGAISDYGYSLSRPLYALAGIWLVPALIYMVYFGWMCGMHGTQCHAPLAPFGLSFANLFSFFGLNRLYFTDLLKDGPGWLQALAGFETVSGFVLLFFLGLGLRNHFRLK